MSIRSVLERLFGPPRPSRPLEPGFPDRQVSSGILAEKIVNDYGRALAEGAKFPLGAPESLLPRSRESIAAAIFQYARSLYRANKLTAQIYDQLHIGYVELAHFVPDHDARAGASAWAAVQSGDVDAYTDETSEAMARHQAILAEKAERGAEFDKIAAQEGISMGLAE